MSAAPPATDVAAKPSKLPLILGVVLALAGAGGGFYVTYSGLLGGGDPPEEPGHSAEGAPTGHDAPAAAHLTPQPVPAGAAAFVPIDPITINLGPRSDSRHLRFGAQIEVPAGRAAEVQQVMPRILDVLNLYLRALDPHEIEEPAALMRLRAQMLRRVRIVAGPDAINDLLITEFVFN